jgi:hypothetical protein
MRIGIQKVFIPSGSFVDGTLPTPPATLDSSIIDCADFNLATVFVEYAGADPTSQVRASGFLSPSVDGSFSPALESPSTSTAGVADSFTMTLNLTGARRFNIEFEEVGFVGTPGDVTATVVLSHERGTSGNIPSAGMNNPMTGVGDLIRGGTSGEPARIAPGSNNSVLTLLAGVPVWSPPSGGPTIGTGTYAARPASPTEGDTYTVTSGVRRGSVYRCDVAGIWTLLTVAVPQLSACVAIFDSEDMHGAAGQRVRFWKNRAPSREGYNLNVGFTNGGQNSMTAIGSTGMLAYAPATTTQFQGVLPYGPPGNPRTVAALVNATGPTANYSVGVVGWGDITSCLEIAPRSNNVDNWGLVYGGTDARSAVSSVGTGVAMLVATYDGVNARLYLNGALILTDPRTLPGGAVNGIFTAMSSVVASREPASGTLYFAGGWNAQLSALEIATLEALLRERFVL